MRLLKLAAAATETAAKLAIAGAKSRTVTAAYYKCFNFGDLLTPDVFTHFGVECLRVPLHRYSSVVGVGSILHMIPSSYGGTILGSGFISQEHFNEFPNASIKLVRGKLTREVFANRHDVQRIDIGDPGLLARDLYSKAIAGATKKYKLGVIPHYADADVPDFKSLSVLSSPDVTVLDVRCQPVEMARKMSECEHIVSSSLHGLIFADSLGIPNRWAKFSNNLIGGDFKFRDYYSCFDTMPSPIELNRDCTLEDLVAQTRQLDSEKVDGRIAGIAQAVDGFCSASMRTHNPAAGS